MQRRLVNRAWLWVCLHFAWAGTVLAAETPGVLTWEEALRRGLQQHPSLAPYVWEIEAREAAVRQAGRLPNPSLGVEVEDVGGTGSFGGIREAQTTIALSQPVELGGKRTLRTQIARASRSEAELEWEFQKQEVIFQVRKAFLAVMQAQEKEKMLAEGIKLAAEVMTTVEAKVDAGKVSPVELVKARSAKAAADKERELAALDLATARAQLTLAWGSAAPEFASVAGTLAELQPLPVRDVCLGLLMTNAVVRLSQAGVRRSEEELKLADRNRLPDVTLSAGYRNLSSGNDHAMVFGATVPLPLFRQQTDAILGANARLEKARAEQAALRQRLHAEMLGHLSVVERTLAQSRNYREELLPAAKEVFTKTQEGYSGGKFGYLELLDAQRVLLDSRLEHLDVLYRYQLARAELDRLLGLTPVEDK